MRYNLSIEQEKIKLEYAKLLIIRKHIFSSQKRNSDQDNDQMAHIFEFSFEYDSIKN